ncbi:MAG TPA: hypothetical protein VFV76_07100 [Actinomycetes bacterium]|nr:hypothetical protein [Actinomycetes bacterium]
MTQTTDMPAIAPTDDVVMTMLHEHVPLSLLCDLAADGPGSAEIMAREGAPEVRWWER